MPVVERLSLETERTNKAKLDEFWGILPGEFAEGLVNAGKISVDVGVHALGDARTSKVILALIGQERYLLIG